MPISVAEYKKRIEKGARVRYKTTWILRDGTDCSFLDDGIVVQWSESSGEVKLIRAKDVNDEQLIAEYAELSTVRSLAAPIIRSKFLLI